MSDSQLLWLLLLLLFIAMALVGPKASASLVELKPDSGFKRPMLAFEMKAGQASKLFKNWDTQTRSQLKKALYWDFLFLLIYPAAIAVACYLAGLFLDAKGIIPFKVTLLTISLQLVAAVFDIIENWLLLKILQDNQVAFLPLAARFIATIKFLLVIVGLAYSLLLGGGSWLVHQLRNQ